MESKSNGSRIRKSKQFTGLLGQKEARMADFPPKRIIKKELKIRLRLIKKTKLSIKSIKTSC